jgi:hypothetical protein
MSKQGGTKYDQGKAPLDLIPYDSLEEIAEVLRFGAEKYDRANWANGISYSRLIAAAMRHLGKYNNGEDLDDETNTLHIANAATNLIFLIWMHKNRPDLDDRWVKGIGSVKNEGGCEPRQYSDSYGCRKCQRFVDIGDMGEFKGKCK